MPCPQCGLRIPEGAAFCATCGWRAMEAPSTAPDEPGPPEIAAPEIDPATVTRAASRPRGFVVSGGARRLALAAFWVNFAIVVCLDVFAALWPKGLGLAVGEARSRVELLALIGYLWPLAPVAWLAALLAVAGPPGPTRLRRWPAYLSLGVLGLVAGGRGAWVVGHLIASGAAVSAYGPHAPAAAEARAWLLCTLSAIGLSLVACGVLVAAGTRQYGAATERTAVASGRGGFSAAARTLATCAGAGALATVVVSFLRSGFTSPASYDHAWLFGTQSVVLGAALTLLVTAGWLVPALVFGLEMRRFPTAAWIAAGAAGVLLILLELNAAVSAVRWYRATIDELALRVVPASPSQHVARGTLAAALVLYAMLALFGIALVVAAVLQYRASRAPTAAATSARARWRPAATAAVVLAIVALTAPWSARAVVGGGAQPSSATVLLRPSPRPSSSSAPSGVEVTPAPTPGDGVPAVAEVIPLPGGLSGWSGDTVQVGLVLDGDETIDTTRCAVWVDGRLMSGVGYMTSEFTPGQTTLAASWPTPVQGSEHTFRVLVVTGAGKELECTWRW